MPNGADIKVVGKAFKVEINGQFLPIKSYSGGDPSAEKVEPSAGSAPAAETTLGPSKISELTLQAYITPTQKVLSDAADLVCNKGQDTRFKISLADYVKAGTAYYRRTKTFDPCLITSLDFPSLGYGTGELFLTETATFQPENRTLDFQKISKLEFKRWVKQKLQGQLDRIKGELDTLKGSEEKALKAKLQLQKFDVMKKLQNISAQIDALTVTESNVV